MTKSKLQLNESKTEFVLFEEPSGLNEKKNPSVVIKSDTIVPSQKAKNLGIIFDQTLSMTDQVTLHVKVCDLKTE